MYFKICWLLLITPALAVRDIPCNKLDTEYGHVCVCNSSYCDTINTPERLHKERFHFYYTSKRSPGFNHNIGVFNKRISSYGEKFVVNLNKKFQTIRGFGGAFTDLFGSAFNTLPHEAQEKLIKSFFSEEGVEYTMCRIVLGSSDFSLRNYSYLPHYDPTLKSFNLTEDDYLYKISKVKWALNVTKRNLYFLGSTWTAPSWMKTNNLTTSGYLKSEFRQLWADYYIKALDAFKKEGIEFWGLTTGNEPITLYQIKTLPNLAMFPEEQRDWFVNNLGPALRKSGYDLKIIFLDDMRIYAMWWMNVVMSNPEIKNYSTGIGLHWYTDGVSDPRELDNIQKKYPEQEIIYTESSINVILGNITDDEEKTHTSSRYNNSPSNDAGIPKLGSWGRAAMYVNNIIENLNHWVTTYMDWNLGLNLLGGPNLLNSSCDASIIIDEKFHIFYKQPIYYVMGHFSKFMAPGSVVIDIQKINDTQSHNYDITDNLDNKRKWKPEPNYHIQYTGVLNPDYSRTIIFYNPKPFDVQIIVHEPKRGYAVLVLEGDSINTLIYW